MVRIITLQHANIINTVRIDGGETEMILAFIYAFFEVNYTGVFACVGNKLTIKTSF